MSRSWCTFSSADDAVQFDSLHLGSCAAESGVAAAPPRVNSAKVKGDIAAQHGIAAKALEAEVAREVECSILRFNASIVCSRSNLAWWPCSSCSAARVFSDGTQPLVANVEDEVRCTTPRGQPLVGYHTSHIWNAFPSPEALSNVQLPSDQIVDFLNHIVRTEAQSKDYRTSDNMRHVTLMLAPAKTVAIHDIFTVICANHRMLGHLRSLTVSGEFVEGSSIDDFQNFFHGAKELEVLGLPNTKFGRVAESLLPMLKDTMIRVLDLEGNDLGLTKDDSDALAQLVEFIKFNKFVVDLNLNNNNINGITAQQLLEALVKSDTRLYPQDVQDGEEDAVVDEEDDGVGLESVSFFIGQDEEEDEGDDFEDDEEVEDPVEEEGTDQDGTQEGGSPLMKDGSDNENDDEEDEEDEGNEEQQEDAADGDAEEEGEEEEEEEEDEEGEGKPKPLPPHLERKFNRLFRRLYKEERELRRGCANQYVREASLLMEEHAIIREELAEEKRVEIDKYCRRRSGWSHIQVLRLRGNPIGNKGAVALASALRHELQLEEEEEERIQKDLSNDADRLLNKLTVDYKRTLVEESRERDRMQSEYLLWLQTFKAWITGNSRASADVLAIDETATFGAASDYGGEFDEDQHGGDEEQEQVVHEDDQHIPSPDGEGDVNNIEEEISALLDVLGKWSIPVTSQKRCVPFLRVLDLGSCQIGSHGMKHIGNVLAENKTVECLLLRRNVFGRKRAAKVVEDVASDGDEAVAPSVVDVPSGVTPGCSSLFAALRRNNTLKVLDLAYNDMYPETIRALAESLRTNKTITSLSLEGNRIGFVELSHEAGTEVLGEGLPDSSECPDVNQEGSKSSCFFELLSAVAAGNITTLLLGFNDLSQCWGDDEVEALGGLCSRLDILHLNGNELGPEHILKWSGASPEGNFVLRELQLSRNNLGGAEGGGALGCLLSRCKGTLERLSLDQIPLGAAGVSATFKFLKPSGLRFLSIKNTEVADAKAFPDEVLGSLQELIVSDNPFTAGELLNFAELLRSNATRLELLSLWSRKLEMESHLPVLAEVIRQIKSLLFVDLGVLLRFDGAVDAEDALGQLEATLTARRMEHLTQVVATV